MVGNIFASVTTNQPKTLQIVLGVLTSEYKSVIDILYKFWITSNYYEVRRFLRSAAMQAARDTALAGLSDKSVCGLVQEIIYNFDAVIHLQNCQLDCHNLAMVVTQLQPIPVSDDNSIPRISKVQMKELFELIQTVVRYRGPKNPSIPFQASLKFMRSDEPEQAVSLSLNWARELDFNFLLSVLQKPGTPEYNGLNTRICREVGMMPAGKCCPIYAFDQHEASRPRHS